MTIFDSHYEFVGDFILLLPKIPHNNWYIRTCNESMAAMAYAKIPQWYDCWKVEKHKYISIKFEYCVKNRQWISSLEGVQWSSSKGY